MSLRGQSVQFKVRLYNSGSDYTIQGQAVAFRALLGFLGQNVGFEGQIG